VKLKYFSSPAPLVKIFVRPMKILEDLREDPRSLKIFMKNPLRSSRIFEILAKILKDLTKILEDP